MHASNWLMTDRDTLMHAKTTFFTIEILDLYALLNQNFLRLKFYKTYKFLFGRMSWTGPSNMVELFHDSPFSYVFDMF